jgi:cysteine-rich repeat protein
MVPRLRNCRGDVYATEMRILPLVLMLTVAACHPETIADDDDDSAAPVPSAPSCGDGALDDGEQCDDGDANSDTEPDACRTSCLLPWCGDGVADGGEECDDGTATGGDGCTPACTTEDGPLESEPNDDPGEADAWDGDPVHGGLDAGDVDCFSFDLENCAAVEARLIGDCPAPATLTLHDPSDNELAVGTPDADGCAVLDPEQAPGARFVEEGQWAVCVHGLLGGAVPYYVLEIDVIAPEDASYTVDPADDPDGDGKPDKCDVDRDGDGVDNDDDNCPDTPNGPDALTLEPSADGFIRTWLGAGPFTGLTSEDSCLPTTANLVAEDDALATPAIGDAAGEFYWTVLWSNEDRIEYLTDYGHVDAPREVYTAVYVYSATARDLTLGLGPDDGAYAWFNGELVISDNRCQGTAIDAFTTGVSMLEGWNTLICKVYDQGGGWGNYARFLDGETPVLDLELSLDPAGPWISDQVDSDGDGEGDVCDDTPMGG